MKLYIFILQLFLLITCLLCARPYHKTYQQPFVLVLDPAGDAKRTGRRIGDSFERGLTLQCAEKIKEIIQDQVDRITIYITRLPGDIVYDLQNASLSNRVYADLFVNINFYYSQETKPSLYLYQFSYGNDFAHTSQNLSFVTYDQAYLLNKDKTDLIVSTFYSYLNQETYKNLFTVHQPYKIPIKPLIGITSPCFSLEAGIKDKNAWKHLIEPISKALIKIIENTWINT